MKSLSQHINESKDFIKEPYTIGIHKEDLEKAFYILNKRKIELDDPIEETKNFAIFKTEDDPGLLLSILQKNEIKVKDTEKHNLSYNQD